MSLFSQIQIWPVIKITRGTFKINSNSSAEILIQQAWGRPYELYSFNV